MRGVRATTALVMGIGAVSAAACSLSLDFDGLRTRAPDAGGELDAAGDAAIEAAAIDASAEAAAPSAIVKCGGATCSSGEGCCVEGDGGTRCAVASACTAMFAPCDGSEDCATGDVCCGWGSYENSGNPLVVACRGPSVCASQGGFRVYCNVDAPKCELEQRCIATGTLPGAFKCE